MIETHRLAQKLATGFQALGGKLLNPTETNMAWLDFKSLNIPIGLLTLRAEEIQPIPLVIKSSRFVIHHQITDEAIDEVLELIKKVKEEVEQNGVDGKSLLSSVTNSAFATFSRAPY